MNERTISTNKNLLAYVVGLALGDGNLSNPNGRAVRLRITCDKNYPRLLKCVNDSPKELLPENKVGIVNRIGCVDVSCYSNHWEGILGWEARGGSKIKQRVTIPSWIKSRDKYIRECLRGLFQTDGSIYSDRGYLMVNFVTEIPTLAEDVFALINEMGYKASYQKLNLPNNKVKSTIRISKDARGFIKKINLWKN